MQRGAWRHRPLTLLKTAPACHLERLSVRVEAPFLEAHFILAVFLKLGDRLKKTHFNGDTIADLERAFLQKYPDRTLVTPLAIAHLRQSLVPTRSLRVPAALLSRSGS